MHACTHARKHTRKHAHTRTHTHTARVHPPLAVQVGGRLVYSTCTFNPIEDEAVVAEVLTRCGGAMRLVDPSGMLPLLRRTPGKHTWRVKDKNRCVCRDVCVHACCVCVFVCVCMRVRVCVYVCA